MFSLDMSDVATVHVDDGHLNLFNAARFDGLVHALDEAQDAAVVLVGRSGVLTAGLDLSSVTHLDAGGTIELVRAFGRAVMALWTHPRPVVIAATGHAIATGTMLSMAADHTVAATGRYRWGLTETSIGMVLPHFAIALARSNVAPDRLDDLLLPGRSVTPEEAVAVGFADELAEPEDVIERAVDQGRRLAALDAYAYAEQKRRLRGATAARVLAELDEDAASFARRVPTGADR
jgi:enoyl-CoA hydratase